MSFFCLISHDIKTVAIDTGYVWKYKIAPDKKYSHIVEFGVCKRCNKRFIEYRDATEEGRSYAKNGHEDVAITRAKWLSGGSLTEDGRTKYVDFFDTSYAPNHGVDQWLDAFKNDEEFGKLIKENKLVDDALGQLEVAVKMCNNNKIKS